MKPEPELSYCWARSYILKALIALKVLSLLLVRLQAASEKRYIQMKNCGGYIDTYLDGI